jgi:hypothetical protein
MTVSDARLIELIRDGSPVAGATGARVLFSAGGSEPFKT